MQQKNGLALDIDETLSQTDYFWVEFLQSNLGNPEKLSPAEMRQKYKYAQNVSYWQTETGFQLMEFLRNDNDFQEKLPLIENANTVVQKINKIIPVRAYITARPGTVLNGTAKWLKKHNFPEAEIITRPDNIKPDEGNKWKAGLLEKMYPQIMGIIDDNPSLIDNLSPDYKGTVFLYDGLSHPRTDIKVVPCRDWNHVWQQIRKVLG